MNSMKKKTKRILVVVVKWHHPANGLSHDGHMYFFLDFFCLYIRIEKNLNWSRYSFRYYKIFAFVIWSQNNTLDQEI